MSEDESIMLNVDPLTGAERKFGELPLEARHSICLEIAKQKRQSVASSIFIPKELCRKAARTRRMTQKRDKLTLLNKKSIKCGIEGKKRKSRLQQKTAKEQQMQKKLLLSLKHPESFPIVRQTVSSEKIRTVVESLRDHNELESEPQAEPEELEEMQEQISREKAVFQQTSVITEEHGEVAAYTADTAMPQMRNLDMPNLEQLEANVPRNAEEMVIAIDNGTGITITASLEKSNVNQEETHVQTRRVADDEDDVICYGTIYLPPAHDDEARTTAYIKREAEQKTAHAAEHKVESYGYLQSTACSSRAMRYEHDKELAGLQDYNMTQQPYGPRARDTAKELNVKFDTAEQYYYTQSHSTLPDRRNYEATPKLPRAVAKHSTHTGGHPVYVPPFPMKQVADYDYESRLPPAYPTHMPPFSQHFPTYLPPAEHTPSPYAQHQHSARNTNPNPRYYAALPPAPVDWNQPQAAMLPYSNAAVHRKHPSHRSAAAARHQLRNTPCFWPSGAYVTAAPTRADVYHRLPPAAAAPAPPEMTAIQLPHDYVPPNARALSSSVCSPIDLTMRAQQMYCRGFAAPAPAPYAHINAHLSAYQPYAAPHLQRNVATYAPQSEVSHVSHYWHALQHSNFGTPLGPQQQQQQRHQQPPHQHHLEAANAYANAYALNERNDAPFMKQSWYY